MKFTDTNNSWNPPVGFTLTKVLPAGTLTGIEFRQILPNAVSIVVVYVNDQGREVFRTQESDDLYIEPEPRTPRQPRFGFLPSYVDRLEDTFNRVLDFILA
jgi:hypothetical protein